MLSLILFLDFLFNQISSKTLRINYKSMYPSFDFFLIYPERYYPSNSFANTYLTKTSFIRYSIEEILPVEIKEKLKTVNYLEFKSSFELYDQTKIIDFPYIIYPSRGRDTHEGIGLGFKFEDEKFSFVHQLYNQKIIEKKAFGFSYNKETDNGTLFFGSNSEVNFTQFKYKGKIKVNEKHASWGSNIIGIVYNNKVYSFNSYAILNSGFFGVIFSHDFFDFMIDTFFKDKIDEKVCSLEQMNSGCDYLVCNPEKIDISKESIILMYGEISIKLPLNLLFTQKQRGYVSSFYSNPFREYKNTVILGMEFISLFEYTVFDYDNKAIFLYSNSTEMTQLKFNGLSKEVIIKVIIAIISLICFILIFLYIIILNLGTKYN